MVRKTKEDAEATRQRIIDAARATFLEKGVSRTTMEQIALHAGVTRGAIYWHFTNKTDLFHAMREQVLLPQIDRIDETLLLDDDTDPLRRIENFFCGTIELLEQDLTMRHTYEIMMTKCEYVDEFALVLEQIISNCSSFNDKIRLLYERAGAQGLLREGDEPARLAMDSHLFFTGLLHMWVKDKENGNIRRNARDIIRTHLRLRRARPA